MRPLARGLDAPSLFLLAAKGHLLAKEAEVWVVAKETQHDEVGVEAVEAVTGVGVAAAFARQHSASELVDCWP